jgi:hypothetical protein
LGSLSAELHPKSSCKTSKQTKALIGFVGLLPIPRYEGQKITPAARQKPILRNLKKPPRHPVVGVAPPAMIADSKEPSYAPSPTCVCMILRSIRLDSLGVGALTNSEVVALRDIGRYLSYTRRNEFGLQTDYPALMRDIIKHFLARPPGCEVHLVPHLIVRGGSMALEDDLRASAALQEEFPALRLAPGFAAPSAAKSYIAGFDFFMGARMHACIAAFSSGVPVVPMAYSRKFAGLFGSLGYDHTVDCQSETNTAILEKIAAAFENRVTLATETASAARRGQAKLMTYQDALRQIQARVRP